MISQPNNQNAITNRDPYNPAAQHPPAPQQGNSYTWYTGFMCKEHLSALQFIRKFHKAQICMETTLLIIFSLAAIESFAIVFLQGFDAGNVDWAESISSAVSILLICAWFATSLYLNYRALQSARSTDSRIREEGSYRCATKIGMASSILVTFFCMGGAITGVFMCMFLAVLFDNPNSHNESLNAFIGFIIVYCVGMVFVGVFPLCLAVMACKNLTLLDETWNLTNLNDTYGTELRRNSYR